MSDIAEIQKKLDEANMNIKGLIAQLEATKQVANENIQSNLQLRTNVVLFQQSNQELSNDLESHKTKVADLSAKILELQPPAANDGPDCA